MANLSPWFEFIQAARRSLDLADSWLSSKEMEVLDSYQAEEDVMIDDKDLDQTKAVNLSRAQLLVKLDEYRARLDDPLRVGQALGHIFLTPDRLVHIEDKTNDLRQRLFGGLPQKFSIATIDPLSWNILASFLKHPDSRSAYDSKQGTVSGFASSAQRFEVLAAYLENIRTNSMPYVATWEAASRGAFGKVRTREGLLPLVESKGNAQQNPMPPGYLVPQTPEGMLRALDDPLVRNQWKPAQAVWYIEMVLKHPEEADKAFRVARPRGMLFSFRTVDQVALERFKRWACHCAILVRSNGIWVSSYSTFSRELNPNTLDRLFAALFLL